MGTESSGFAGRFHRFLWFEAGGDESSPPVHTYPQADGDHSAVADAGAVAGRALSITETFEQNRTASTRNLYTICERGRPSTGWFYNVRRAVLRGAAGHYRRGGRWASRIFLSTRSGRNYG